MSTSPAVHRSLTPEYLSPQRLTEALALRDLSDPAQGAHPLQRLIGEAVRALTGGWDCPWLEYRGERVVSAQDNYDNLGYPEQGPARAARYTRWVGPGRLLRTQTSALVPPALRSLPAQTGELLLSCPGIVYRRDQVDRWHVGEPHQLDLWRIRREPTSGEDLQEMIRLIMHALLPGREWRALPAQHPYTTGGVQLDARNPEGEWLEIGECGLANRMVLRRAGLPAHHGLAMGLGLDRLMMLRCALPDIRLLRSADPRVLKQLEVGGPYRPVSVQPAIRRDISLLCPAGMDLEILGDRAREALGEQAELLEELEILTRTPVSLLPEAARARLGARGEGQENLLIRLTLRHLSRPISKSEANQLRELVSLRLSVL